MDPSYRYIQYSYRKISKFIFSIKGIGLFLLCIISTVCLEYYLVFLRLYFTEGVCVVILFFLGVFAHLLDKFYTSIEKEE